MEFPFLKIYLGREWNVVAWRVTGGCGGFSTCASFGRGRSCTATVDASSSESGEDGRDDGGVGICDKTEKRNINVSVADEQILSNCATNL